VDAADRAARRNDFVPPAVDGGRAVHARDRGHAELSFLVFTFDSPLVAIQVAGGQYTPRIIATTLLRDNVIRFTVGCFVFTMVLALRVLSRLDEMVHQFSTFIVVMCGTFSIMVFLYLIDYAARLPRPISIVQRVGASGVEVIATVYPEVRPRPAKPGRRLPSPVRVVANAGKPGWCSPWI
jgi:uncharacterized membrane protein